MKTLLYGGLLCHFLSGCVTVPNNFIPGTYVRTVINEFSIGRDTLIIGAVSATVYTIIHKGSYRRIKDSKLQPAQSIAENWTATYDTKKQVLMEAKKGKIISFDPAKNILLVGSSPYKKIK